MPTATDVCKLVIGNIELLEAAPQIIKEVESKIFKEANRRIKDFFERREGWKGVYTYNEDDDGAETTFAPSTWPENEDGEYLLYYMFCENAPDEGAEYNLTALVGKHPEARFGFCFGADHQHFGQKKAQWRKFLGAQYQSRNALQASLLFDGYTLFLPITLDSKLLSEEYPDFDQCLNPVEDALNLLISITPELNELVTELSKSSEKCLEGP